MWAEHWQQPEWTKALKEAARALLKNLLGVDEDVIERTEGKTVGNVDAEVTAVVGFDVNDANEVDNVDNADGGDVVVLVEVGGGNVIVGAAGCTNYNC